MRAHRSCLRGTGNVTELYNSLRGSHRVFCEMSAHGTPVLTVHTLALEGDKLRVEVRMQTVYTGSYGSRKF